MGVNSRNSLADKCKSTVMLGKTVAMAYVLWTTYQLCVTPPTFLNDERSGMLLSNESSKKISEKYLEDFSNSSVFNKAFFLGEYLSHKIYLR
ncbi:MAG: hypothetical protein ACP5NV_06225 [Candidatus Woesearchaeota archaeon]